jgi:hypothetical protein
MLLQFCKAPLKSNFRGSVVATKHSSLGDNMADVVLPFTDSTFVNFNHMTHI